MTSRRFLEGLAKRPCIVKRKKKDSEEIEYLQTHDGKQIVWSKHFYLAIRMTEVRAADVAKSLGGESEKVA